MDCLSLLPPLRLILWLGVWHHLFSLTHSFSPKCQRPSDHQLCYDLYSVMISVSLLIISSSHLMLTQPFSSLCCLGLGFCRLLLCKCVTLCVSLDVSGESSQSGAQFPGRPSEVWSQWQNQHHSQQAGEQHTHPNPSQTEVFQVTLCCVESKRLLLSVHRYVSCMSSAHTWPPHPCVSAGHVTHGWRSHPGNRQLQHWGLRWSRHVPPLLWVTLSLSLSISLPVRTGLMFAFISHVLSHFSMLLVHNTQLTCSTVNVCSSLTHRNTHSVCVNIHIPHHC